jgi:hypothetical protein
MYRRPKFLEILIAIREDMARQADYDTDLFAEMVRADLRPSRLKSYSVAENGEPVPDASPRTAQRKARRIAK